MAMRLMFVHNQKMIIYRVCEIKIVRLVNFENYMTKSNVFDMAKQEEKDEKEKKVTKKLDDAYIDGNNGNN